jgi:MFS family permease
MRARRAVARPGFRGLASNTPLARVAVAYALFVLTEYAVWIAMLLYAYDQGGPTTAGVVAVAQLVPAALVAPLAARTTVHRSPVRVLRAGYVAQAGGMAATALAISGGRPYLAYAAATVASTAVTTTRPAQAALVPSLAETPDELTASNVVLGWIESLAIMAAGLLVGVLVDVGGPGAVFAACAMLGATAGLLVVRVRAPALAAAEPAVGGVRERRRRARAGAEGGWRPLVVVLAAEAVVVGALDLLFVLLAVDVLHRPQAWVGFLNLAYGAGAVLSGAAAALLVGRRLGPPVLASGLLLSVVLAALGANPGSLLTLLALAGVGGCRSLLDVGARTLLQRTAPAHELARIFGVVEGLTMAGLAAGALLVPLLARLGGSTLALLGVAAVLPLAGLLVGRRLLRLDAAARVPVVEIALLRSQALFAELPPPAIEGLARGLRLVELRPGEVLIRQGEPGHTFYAIASGELEAWRDGELVRRCGRGEGVGEIALLRQVPRTTTVRAGIASRVYALDRDPFLTVVTGHPPTLGRAGALADARLLEDATRPAPASRPLQ